MFAFSKVLVSPEAHNPPFIQSEPTNWPDLKVNLSSGWCEASILSQVGNLFQCMVLTDRDCHNIVVLTGAGISQESGLETFRDENGIWAKTRLEEVATPLAFAKDPERVHQFYNFRRRQLLSNSVKPNAAHLALAELEQQWEGRLLLVTQNIDDLHERAGSRNPIHMHGELLKARCQACARVQPCRQDLDVRTSCAGCGSTGSLRPHVVWFGEVPLSMDEILQELEHVDLFIAIGTSGNVYPAAGFVERACSSGAMVAELNMEPSVNASSFDERIYGPATSTVPGYVRRILDKGGSQSRCIKYGISIASYGFSDSILNCLESARSLKISCIVVL